jgi:hypothetical protein
MIIRSVILCYNKITDKLCTVLLSIMNILVSSYKVTFELNLLKTIVVLVISIFYVVYSIICLSQTSLRPAFVFGINRCSGYTG